VKLVQQISPLNPYIVYEEKIDDLIQVTRYRDQTSHGQLAISGLGKLAITLDMDIHCSIR